MRTLARWCFRRRWLVLIGWIAGLFVLGGLANGIGDNYKDEFKLSGTDSFDAINLLQKSAPKASGDQEQIVVAAKDGKITDAANRDRVEKLLAKVKTAPHVESVDSPFASGNQAQISKDGRIAFANVTMDDDVIGLPVDAANKLVSTAQSFANDQVQVELGGQAIENARQQDAQGGTDIGFLAAFIVLLIVFGSILAAILPLLTAAFALGVGISVIGLLSNAITMASFSSQLSLLIGLGVGVDYALFIVTRYRQEIMRGATPEDAAVSAIDTSGRAVLFAGITVCIALLGMFALGVSFLYGVATASAIVVAFTVFASLTLLPAFLALFGKRVLTRKQRKAVAAGQLATSDESPAWSRWSGLLERRPLVMAIAAAVVMLLLATPALDLRLGNSDAGNDPTDSTTRKAYDLLAEGFGPGFNGPLQLVAENKGGEQGKVAFQRVADAVAKADGVVAVTKPVTVGDNIQLAQVYPAHSPQSQETNDLVKKLRDDVVPPAEQDQIRVLVGGNTAIGIDFSKVLADKLPLFIGVVVLLSFLLLMAVFRSLIIPAMAACMNLLSVAAALGVVTAVFQKGWGAELIGVDSTGPIEAFVPVMVFAILFGLSMDYEVFLVSRIYEEWHKRGDNREAIRHGLAATGRTITAAAAIMVLVFGAFVLGGERVIKLFGIGLASAVFLDALIVRSVLVPGLMLLVGERNWWLPAWLDRIVPRLNVEGEGTTASVPSGQQPPQPPRPATENA